MIKCFPGSQQDRSDTLSRRSYLASKEGDIAYDQQYSALLKPKRLLLRTGVYYNINGFNTSQRYLCKSAFKFFGLEIQAIMCRF
jgi:hypothetical protein